MPERKIILEKILLVNSQSYEVDSIELQGESLKIVFNSTPISELEEVFTNKCIVSTIKVLTEADEQTASYVGYTKFVSITKDGDTGLTTVVLGKIDETQAKIEELEKQIQALNEIVAKLFKS